MHERPRASCLCRRRLLGEIARVAARTVPATIRTLTGERDLAVGIVACLQTHGSRANWHPHLHLRVTDGGLRPDGTFVAWPADDRSANAVTYRSDKSEGPTAGTETVDPLEFLARVLVHSADRGHVTPRYHGRYAHHPRGVRGKAAPAAPDGPTTMVSAPRLPPSASTRRWAALLQQIVEVDPLACPACHGTMRVVAFFTQASVIDQILTHLRTRAGPVESAGGPRRPTGGPPRRWRARGRPLTGTGEAGDRGPSSPHPD